MQKPYESENPWVRLTLGWSPERARKLSRPRRALIASFLSVGLVAGGFALVGRLSVDFTLVSILALLLGGWVLAPVLGALARRGLLRHPLAPELAIIHISGDEALEALRARVEAWRSVLGAVGAGLLLAGLGGVGELFLSGDPDRWFGVALLVTLAGLMANWASGFEYRAALAASAGKTEFVASASLLFSEAFVAVAAFMVRFFGAAIAAMLFSLLMTAGEEPAFAFWFNRVFAILLGGVEAFWARLRFRLAKDLWSAGAAAALARELREGMENNRLEADKG